VLTLVILVVVVVLFFGGIWGRKRCGLEVSSAYRTDLAILVCGVGGALVTGIVPLWVIARRAIYGGTIGDNLPSGVSEDVLLGLVIAGAIITIVAAVNRYLDRIKTE
jgi:hypothetical protein